MANRILAAATRRFAEHGLAETTLRTIAADLKITHASLLHHYASKELLYSAVLTHISRSLDEEAAPVEAGDDPVSDVLALVTGYFDWSLRHDDYARVILRELMDNRDRAARARRWHLAPLVRRCIALVRRCRTRGSAGRLDAGLFVMRFVGATAYFFAALPTLTRILDRAPRRLIADFRRELVADCRLILHGSRT